MKTRIPAAAAMLLVCLCCLFRAAAFAEDTPSELRFCTNAEEAKAFIDLTANGDGTYSARDAVAGRIRHVPQCDRCPYFISSYWITKHFDLTQTTSRVTGKAYPYYAGTMCTRAVYSEMLSYFGIDYTPAEMSDLLNRRDIKSPYDEVTDLIPGLTRTEGDGYPDLAQMMDNYISDPSYSPVMIILRYTDRDAQHALLLVGRDPSVPHTYIAVDTAYHNKRGELCFVMWIRLNWNESRMTSAETGYETMTVRSCFQWHYEQPE